MRPEAKPRDPDSRIRLLEDIFIACHRTNSVAELETALSQVVTQHLPIQALKISFRRSDLENQNFLEFPLRSDGDDMGVVQIALDPSRKLRKQDQNLLEKLAGLIGTTIDRLAKTEEAETLKQEWESTFDAMKEPVVLISPDHRIIRANKTYSELAHEEPSKVVDRKCYEVLFNRDQPCSRCKLGERFELSQVGMRSGEIRSLEVRTQSLQRTPIRGFVVHYADVTAKKLYESRMMESAKLAELGTIGSSIAHELNNPIAGMLTFVQLLKMDLKGDESYYQDVLEIEAGVLRCRDIVRNLLSFSRQESQELESDVDLIAAVEQAKAMIELQSQWKGIPFLISGSSSRPLVKGNRNLLVQALVHLLQDSLEALQRRKKREQNFSPKIELRLENLDAGPVIELIDNGLPSTGLEFGPDLRPGQSLINQTVIPGLSRTLAFQIIQQHNGKLEFLENVDIRPGDIQTRRAKISFSRPVF